MNLYLVKSPDDWDGYDIYDSFVCSAPDEYTARHTHPDDHGTAWYELPDGGSKWGDFDWGTWPNPKTLTVELIGVTHLQMAKVICASFIAG